MCEPDIASKLKDKYSELVIQRLDITQALARAVICELDNRTFEEKIPRNALSAFDPSASGECPSSASSFQGVIERKLSARAKTLDIVFADLAQHIEVPYAQITSFHPFYDFDWEQVELDFKRQKSWISSSRKHFVALKQQLMSRKPAEQTELPVVRPRQSMAKVKQILGIDARLRELVQTFEGRQRDVLAVDKNVEAAAKRTQATREYLDTLRKRMDLVAHNNISSCQPMEDRSCLPQEIQRQLKDLDGVCSSDPPVVRQHSLAHPSLEQLAPKIRALVSDLIHKHAPSYLQAQVTHFQSFLNGLYESSKMIPPLRHVALWEEHTRLSNGLELLVDFPAQPFKHEIISNDFPRTPHREEGEVSPNPYRSPSRCPTMTPMEDGEIQRTPQAPIRVSDVWGSQLIEQPYQDSDEDMETLDSWSTSLGSDESLEEMDTSTTGPSETEVSLDPQLPTVPDGTLPPDIPAYPEVPFHTYEPDDAAVHFIQTSNAYKDLAISSMSLSPQPLPTEDIDMENERHHLHDHVEGLQTPSSLRTPAESPHDSGPPANQSTIEQWEHITIEALLSLKSRAEPMALAETDPSATSFKDFDSLFEERNSENAQHEDESDEEAGEAMEIMQLVYPSPSSPRHDMGRLSPATPTPMSDAHGGRSPSPLC